MKKSHELFVSFNHFATRQRESTRFNVDISLRNASAGTVSIPRTYYLPTILTGTFDFFVHPHSDVLFMIFSNIPIEFL